MLSFDITDRNIRIVKGVEGSGKIKISSAATLNLEEEVIVNGHVKDVPRVATLINGILKKNRMADKEAIVSISSNLTIFKELNVTKSKGQDFQKIVKQQMLAELNLDDSYSVSYIIVGEATGESEDEKIYKVLATACPYEIVNCYRDVFKMLGISLKSVMIGCNCITKVLLADTKIKSKMPLLAVQIDNNFISLNLYEQGQLSFSRFASIDATDYGNSADYVFEAVNENIFRMLQFHKSRNTGETIENVVFYGDTHDYVRLTDELEKLDLNTSLINVPPQIHGHENLEFSLYANAIGAMFKRNKEIEKINLLETDGMTAIKNKVKSEGGSSAVMLAVLAACALGVGGTYGYFVLKDNKINKQIEEYEADINSPETAAQLDLHEKLVNMKAKVDNYMVIINNAHDALYSQPVVLGKKYDMLEDVVSKTAEENSVTNVQIVSPQYSSGTFTFSVIGDAVEDYTQKLPAAFVENLLKQEDVARVEYSNYVVNEESGDAIPGEDGSVIAGTTEKKVSFDLTVKINGRESAYHAPEEKTEQKEEAN
ncbi:MAG: pilus assembly protein PilM [Oscillospiraceae bacterium]|nr:pilus assembly protein PilM [Oscillospiraceae bacterium]